MTNKKIASVAIAGSVAIGPDSRNPAYDTSRCIKGEFAGSVRVIRLIVSLAAAEH